MGNGNDGRDVRILGLDLSLPAAVFVIVLLFFWGGGIFYN